MIVSLLGQGGFGAVYEAKDERLGHRVALKQLMLANVQAEKAFEREARILARLKHAGLPKVSDYFADANSYFLVMEYIEGDDLQVLLAQRNAPYPVEQVLQWADQLLAALHYLHSQQPQVIHRDIKPANIKLSPLGNVYLLDFGISKGGQTYTDQATQEASIHAFSQHYASMEQIEGRGTDARSDLYSLAVTLHHLLTKQKPPQTVSRVNAKAMNRPDPLLPVSELNPQVPVKVAQVLTSALNFDPNLRPQSANAMRQMLKDAMVLAPEPSPTLPSIPWLAMVGVLLLLVGLLGGIVFFRNSPDTPLPTETSTTEIVVIPVATDTPAPTNTSVPPTPELVAGATRIAEKDGMVQVYVPEGDFEMGSAENDPDAQSHEKPRHAVYLDAFWIDQTVVTNAMFARFVEETGHQTVAEKNESSLVLNGEWESIEGANWQHPQGPESNVDARQDHPVVQMSWNDATAYCTWAERRLPTEAQWEKSAGGILTGEESRKWPWGNEPPTGELVNFCDQNCPIDWKDSSTNDGYERTSPVGHYPAGASPYEALDMAGNVWEWVSDTYNENYYAFSERNNPTGPSATENKVLRGGSWSDPTQNFRVHNRATNVHDNRTDLWSFRCASAP